MGRIIALLLVLAMLLCGCTTPADPNSTKLFYYLQLDPSYNAGSTYIIAEPRHGVDMDAGLETVLNLYLKGPTDRLSYSSPFKIGVQVTSITKTDSILDITLTRGFATHTGLDLTLACACLTMTCLELTDAQTVRIRAKDTTLDGAEFIEMNADSILLLDTSGTAKE